jgi:hypothetical protein
MLRLHLDSVDVSSTDSRCRVGFVAGLCAVGGHTVCVDSRHLRWGGGCLHCARSVYIPNRCSTLSPGRGVLCCYFERLFQCRHL